MPLLLFTLLPRWVSCWSWNQTSKHLILFLSFSFRRGLSCADDFLMWRRPEYSPHAKPVLECGPYFAWLPVICIFSLHQWKCQLNSHTSPNGSGILCYQIWCLKEIVLICIISKWHGVFCMEIFVWIEPGILIAESKLSSINSLRPVEKSSNSCKVFLIAEKRVGQGLK